MNRKTSIGARAITAALGGKWYGRYGCAPCPVCQSEGRRTQSALTIADGADRLLMHCKKNGCAFRDILSAAGLRASDWRAADPYACTLPTAKRDAAAAKHERWARQIWKKSQPIGDTVAEVYLRERSIAAPLPASLRFHPAAYHGPSGCRLPALVALVDGLEGFAVHRTFLAPDGRRKAAVTPAKLMLGRCAGGAVRLGEGPDGLAVAEGIETALSLACGLLRGRPSVWATLSISGMAGLRLPEQPSELIIATDGDAPGRLAGQRLAMRAQALGWRVSLLPAPDGADWNDVVREEMAP